MKTKQLPVEKELDTEGQFYILFNNFEIQTTGTELGT